MEDKVGGEIFIFCMLASVLFEFYYEYAYHMYITKSLKCTRGVGNGICEESRTVEACRKQKGPQLKGEKMLITQE